MTETLEWQWPSIPVWAWSEENEGTLKVLVRFAPVQDIGESLLELPRDPKLLDKWVDGLVREHDKSVVVWVGQEGGNGWVSLSPESTGSTTEAPIPLNPDDRCRIAMRVAEARKRLGLEPYPLPAATSQRERRRLRQDPAIPRVMTLDPPTYSAGPVPRPRRVVTAGLPGLGTGR